MQYFKKKMKKILCSKEEYFYLHPQEDSQI